MFPAKSARRKIHVILSMIIGDIFECNRGFSGVLMDFCRTSEIYPYGFPIFCVLAIDSWFYVVNLGMVLHVPQHLFFLTSHEHQCCQKKKD